MNWQRGLTCIGLAALSAGLAGCDGDERKVDGSTGVVQTGFPGQLTAGGGTSGAVLARNGTATDGTYAGGTPGIAGGSGGTTGGAATAGTVVESGQGPSSGVTAPSGKGQTAGVTEPTRSDPSSGAIPSTAEQDTKPAAPPPGTSR